MVVRSGAVDGGSHHGGRGARAHGVGDGDIARASRLSTGATAASA